MMKFKEKFKELFLYKPHKPYEFVLSENNASIVDTNPPPAFLPDSSIFSDLDKNHTKSALSHETAI